MKALFDEYLGGIDGIDAVFDAKMSTQVLMNTGTEPMQIKKLSAVT